MGVFVVDNVCTVNVQEQCSHTMHRGEFIELVPWEGPVEWQVEPWGRWRIAASNSRYEAVIEATTTANAGVWVCWWCVGVSTVHPHPASCIPHPASRNPHPSHLLRHTVACANSQRWFGCLLS